MLNQQSEKNFFESMDAAEASAARAFIGEDAQDSNGNWPGELSWEERERLNDLERLAYCGYED